MERTILRMGNINLYKKASLVKNLNDAAVQDTINKMLEILRKNGPSIGLAAPQINIPLQIVYFHIPKSPPNPRYKLTPEHDPEGVEPTILINPRIEPIDNKQVSDYETCLSLPGMAGIVERNYSIKYSWDSLEGPKSRIAHGFHARVIQHECDHLNGILYPMRIKDMRNFGYQEDIFSKKIQ